MTMVVVTKYRVIGALFALLLLLSPWGVARNIDWPEDKTKLLQDINQNPLLVIEKVNTVLGESSLSPLEASHYHYILSDAYYALFLGPESLAEAEQALALALESGDVILQQYCRLKLARAYDLVTDPAPGLRYAQEALTWAKQNDSAEVHIEALVARGSIYLSMANFTAALDSFISAYHVAQNVDKQNNTTRAPYIASFIGLVYEAQERHELSVPYFSEAVDYYRAAGNKVELSNSLYGLGFAYGKLGQLGKAMDLLNESMAISVDLDDRQGVAYTTQALVDVLFAGSDEHSADQLSQLMPLLDEAITTFAESGNINMQSHSLLIQAKWYARNALIDDAFEVVTQAESLALNHAITAEMVKIQTLKAQLYAAKSNYKAAYETMAIAWDEEGKRHELADDEKFRELRAGFELDQKEYENRLLAETNARQTAELAVNKRDQTIVALVIAVLVVLFLAIASMYISIRRQHRQLEKLAQTDELTGLYNRRQTLKLLDREKKLAVRQNQPLSVAIADLDDFKYVNDTFGHQVGDKVLKYVGDLIRQRFRNTDIIGRIGGEEFLFVFPAASCEEVIVSLHQFMDACKVLPASLENYPDIQVSFSMGLVDARDNDSVTYTLARADKLMYQAKANGKDQVVS